MGRESVRLLVHQVLAVDQSGRQGPYHLPGDSCWPQIYSANGPPNSVVWRGCSPSSATCLLWLPPHAGSFFVNKGASNPVDLPRALLAHRALAGLAMDMAIQTAAQAVGHMALQMVSRRSDVRHRHRGPDMAVAAAA